ncbi:hypothetical protein J7K24_02425 [bacterium]|nr:hypothetical protein [bacterium]
MSKRVPKKLFRFDEEVYTRLGINNLIIFSLYSLKSEKREKVSFEGLLERCFFLFPKIFRFEKFPQWPDARKLDRPLRLLRNKKLVKGDPSSLFSLTSKGEKKAKEIAKMLFQKKLL